MEVSSYMVKVFPEALLGETGREILYYTYVVEGLAHLVTEKWKENTLMSISSLL